MEFSKSEKEYENTTQEFDFTTAANSLSKIAEKLSPEETAAAMMAIQNIQNNHKNRKGQDFKTWFDAAFLPILKNFAALTGSKLTIQQDPVYDITATLTSRCGFDITANQKQMHMIINAADHISISKWSDSDAVELSLIFSIPENEE